MIRLFNGHSETKELTSHFNRLAFDVHRKAALLNATLSKLDYIHETVPGDGIIRRVISLIATNRRLIEAATEMVNQGVDGGLVERDGTLS